MNFEDAAALGGGEEDEDGEMAGVHEEELYRMEERLKLRRPTRPRALRTI